MADLDRPVKRVQITVDEAVAMAVDFLKESRVADAGLICSKVLELEPDNPNALHYSGVVAHRQADNERALTLIGRSLEQVTDQPDWYSNLGIVLQTMGRFEAAMEAFRRAIAIEPAHANALNNLGVLLRLFGRLDEAEASLRTAIAHDPNHPDVYINLAVVLDQTGRAPEALTAYCKAITLRPSHPEAHRHLALAYSVIGDMKKAVEVCEEWLRNNPNDPRARHALAAYSGRDVPPRAPDDYVQKVFDDFAGSFEAKLAQLSYRAPALVGEALAATGTADGGRDVLDVGCGTGLCGPLLAPYARRLVGVDLSVGMLKLARAKDVYHELVQQELTTYLQQQQSAYDIIVSADTLVYFGDLQAVAVAAASALRPGGTLIFTVEEAAPEHVDAFHLERHGRYSHGAGYVERVLSQAGFAVTIDRGVLRFESGLPVQGLIVRATLPHRSA